MKILPINSIQTNRTRNNTNNSQINKPELLKSTTQIKVPSNLSQGYFTGTIPRANRLAKSDYLISSYIAEISKARRFHGDRASC